MEKVKLIERYKNNIVFIQRNERRETVTKNQIGISEYLNKLKEKLGKDKFLKNMNMEGLYEKLLKELTYRELDYILENPNKILNYVYINSKPFIEEPNSKTIIQTNKENEKVNEKKEEETNSELMNSKFLNKRNKREKKEKNKNLSPRAIYNNLIDLISEKRKERSVKKKQTVNFQNIKINNILNSSKIGGKIDNNENKISKNEKPKKTPIVRSTTLNKARLDTIRAKKVISSFPNYKKNVSSETKYSFKSNLVKPKYSQISDFKAFKNRKNSQFTNLNYYSNENDDINELKDYKNNNRIMSKLMPNPLEEKEQTKKANITRKKYYRDKPQKDTFIFEENISQPMKKEKKMINLGENKDNNKKNKEDVKTNDTESIKKTMEKTFDKYKNKTIRKEVNNNLENEKGKNIDNDAGIDDIKTRERKVTYVQRKKPTFQELRQKVLHKNTKISVSTFY